MASRRIPRPVRGRAPRVLPQLHRNRRGPTPPDTIINTLQTAHTADPDSRTGTWIAALLLAAHALQVKARREVSSAGIAIPAATPDDPEQVLWVQQLHAGVAQRRSTGAAPAAILAWIAAHTLSGFSHAVRHFAIAGGSAGYIWTTRMDEKVRELHIKLEGTRQRWDAPPVSGSSGFRGHPGEPGGCRCTPFPVPAPAKTPQR